MVDIDTFLLELYVMADDFVKAQPTEAPRPGPAASLSAGEVITLALVGQWARFQSERDFYRWAQSRLRSAFPTLPDYGQFNRLQRQHTQTIIAFSHHLVEQMNARVCAYEVMDGFGARTRNCQRRGAGWMAGETDIGRCTRLGWYEGFHVLDAVTPQGVITGFGFAPASTKEQRFAETFLAARAYPQPRLPEVGRPARGEYVTDNGFCGRENHAHWAEDYGARVISPPQRRSRHPWPTPLRRWLARLKQIVETVHDRLLNDFRLDKDRRHTVAGFRMGLAAKVALHNFCIWLNRKHGRPSLAFADLVDW